LYFGETYLIRRAVFRQSRCSPERRLHYIEAAAGLFHLEIQVLAMLFRTHLGDERDNCSLARWIIELNRDKNKLWNGQRNLVKDFRSCLGFWDIVVDGYLIAALASYSGFDSLAEFHKDLTENPNASIRLFDKIKAFAGDLATFGHVNNIRKTSSIAQRDQIYENHFLFLQHALTLRNFILAMRQGDSGRVRVSLSYFTVWFQASKQFNYAMECLHLTACLSKLWSDELVKFWMQNCLINPSGKKEGWMACDYLGEYVVREVKHMMPFNINEATGNTLRNKYSPQIMGFRDTRKIMQEETDAPTFGFHSSTVKTHVDVERVIKRLINEQFSKMRLNRPTGDDPERADLHIMGIEELGNAERIAEYIEKVKTQQGFLNIEWDERTEEIEVEPADSVFLAGGDDDDEEGDQWL
jgi:Family of unknown function (DUF6589)